MLLVLHYYHQKHPKWIDFMVLGREWQGEGFQLGQPWEGGASAWQAIDNKNMSFTSGEGRQHIAKANSLAQFTRNPFLPALAVAAELRESDRPSERQIPDEKEDQGKGSEQGRMARKEKLKQTLQRHSDLKKKYEQLLRGKQEQEGSETREKIQLLAYNQLNESQYAHQPLQQCQEAPLLPNRLPSEAPSFVSIFNGYCLQQFQIVKFFSEGVSGKVYLAQNLRTSCLYSVKVIKRSSLTPVNFNQLVREIKIQSFLSHPNVVRLYHTFVDKESIYLFLEPCLDGDLYRSPRKRNGRFSERETREAVKQVCLAVEYLHRNDIIHRDLKPQNILLHEGVAKICDFGWAVHSPLLRETRCGTTVYVSPQMVKSELYDSKIDIWNIGVLTYELLLGSLPFQIHHADDINKIVEEEVYFPEDIPVSNDAKAFVLGCLNKNPIKRLSIRQAIEHDFLRGSEKYRNSMM